MSAAPPFGIDTPTPLVNNTQAVSVPVIERLAPQGMYTRTQLVVDVGVPFRSAANRPDVDPFAQEQLLPQCFIGETGEQVCTGGGGASAASTAAKPAAPRQTQTARRAAPQRTQAQPSTQSGQLTPLRQAPEVATPYMPQPAPAVMQVVDTAVQELAQAGIDPASPAGQKYIEDRLTYRSPSGDIRVFRDGTSQVDYAPAPFVPREIPKPTQAELALDTPMLRALQAQFDAANATNADIIRRGEQSALGYELTKDPLYWAEFNRRRALGTESPQMAAYGASLAVRDANPQKYAALQGRLVADALLVGDRTLADAISWGQPLTGPFASQTPTLNPDGSMQLPGGRPFTTVAPASAKDADPYAGWSEVARQSAQMREQLSKNSAYADNLQQAAANMIAQLRKFPNAPGVASEIAMWSAFLPANGSGAGGAAAQVDPRMQ